MGQLTRVLMFCLGVFSLLSCNKELSTPAGPGSSPYLSGGNPESGPQGTASLTNSVSLLVNGSPVLVTGIDFDRSGTATGTFDFSVWNAVQRIDVYCFSFPAQSGSNDQFSDSINYSTRPDSLSQWTTVSSSTQSTVNFDCCTAPLIDTAILGQYSGNFSGANPGLIKNQGDQPALTVSGKFNLLFSGAQSCH